MSDQLNKIRMDAQEKLKKEAEVVVEPAKPSLLQQSTADYLSKKEEPHPLSPVQNLNEGKMSQLHLYIKQGKTAKEIAKLMGVDAKTIQKLMAAYKSRDAKNESEENMQEHKGTTPHKHPHEDELDEREKSVRQLINPTKEDELQVKEWFKAKNIDVKVRELDESTQVYVPIGRTIPNEIREELITTQYGKMPEDVKNVKDINYGNFMENSITMNNDFWSKVLHGTKGE